MGHVQSGNIIVVSLPSPSTGEGEGVEVIKSFQMGGNVVHGRVIAGKKRRRNGRKNEVVVEEVAEEDEMEVDAVPDDEDKEEEREGEDKEDDNEEEVKEEVKVEEEQSWISCLGASGDGQWLVAGDTAGRVTIFNLDTLQVSPTLRHTGPSILQYNGRRRQMKSRKEKRLTTRSTAPSPTSQFPLPPSYSPHHPPPSS